MEWCTAPCPPAGDAAPAAWAAWWARYAFHESLICIGSPVVPSPLAAAAAEFAAKLLSDSTWAWSSITVCCIVAVVATPWM